MDDKLENTLTGVKVLSSTSGFLAWGSWQWEEEPQKSWLSRPAGFDHRNSKALWETGTVLLEGTHPLLCTVDPRKKVVTP